MQRLSATPLVHECSLCRARLLQPYSTSNGASRREEIAVAAYAFSAMTQMHQVPVKQVNDGRPRDAGQELLRRSSWPIGQDKHLSSRVLLARKAAAVAMLDRESALVALDSFLQQIKAWLHKHPDKFNPIVSSLALLSVAHLSTRAAALTKGAAPNPDVSVVAALMMHKTLSRIEEATRHAVSIIFWACARLEIRPDDMQAGAEDALGQRFIESFASDKLQGVTNVLWACGILGLNPCHGALLRHIVETMKQTLATDFDSAANMQSLSVAMCAFAYLRLHIEPALAELIITRFYQGLVQGVDEPQGVSNVLWACASLGYLPPPHMLQCFKASYAKSKTPFLVQHDTTVAWSLAVLGVLDMGYFEKIILRIPQQLLLASTLRQLYQALQVLRPSEEHSPAYAKWAEVTHYVQLHWPLQGSTGLRSPFELRIYYTFLQMGYQAIGHFDSGDGLHFIDIALLPQNQVPCKIAVEVDGHTHFLYEDYRLEKGPCPATRPDGKSLFRNAVLERQGWRVLTIPWFDWHQLTTKNAKFDYVRDKVNKIAAQYKRSTRAAKLDRAKRERAKSYRS